MTLNEEDQQALKSALYELGEKKLQESMQVSEKALARLLAGMSVHRSTFDKAKGFLKENG